MLACSFFKLNKWKNRKKSTINNVNNNLTRISIAMLSSSATNLNLLICNYKNLIQSYRFPIVVAMPNF